MTAVTLPQLSICDGGGDGQPLARGRRGAASLAGQPVVEVETDKATIEIDAPGDGVLRIVAAEGADRRRRGSARGARARGRRTRSCRRRRCPPPCPVARRRRLPGRQRTVRHGREHAGRGGPIASPAARRLARERGVDLTALRGSGPGGRIVARDVVASGARAPRSCRPHRRTATGSARRSSGTSPRAGSRSRTSTSAGSSPPTASCRPARRTLPLDVRRDGDRPPRRGARSGPRRGTRAERRCGGRTAPSSEARAVHLSLAVATARRRRRARPPRRRLPHARRGRAGASAPRRGGPAGHDRRPRSRRRHVHALEPRRLPGRLLRSRHLRAPGRHGRDRARGRPGRRRERLVGVRPRMWVNVAIDHRASDGEAGGRLLAALERQIARSREGSHDDCTCSRRRGRPGSSSRRPRRRCARRALPRHDARARLRGRGDRCVRQGADPRLDPPLHRRRGDQGGGALDAAARRPRLRDLSRPRRGADQRRRSGRR